MTLPTKKVMEIFPFLGIPQLMHHEMQMKFGIDMDRSLQTAIHELSPRIIRVVKEGSQKRFSPSLLEPTNERLEDAALLLLPELFKEKTEFLYSVEDEVHPCPTVVFHGSLNVLKADTISIRLDGLTLTTGKMTIAEALEYLFSTLIQHLIWLFEVHDLSIVSRRAAAEVGVEVAGKRLEVLQGYKSRVVRLRARFNASISSTHSTFTIQSTTLSVHSANGGIKVFFTQRTESKRYKK
ncbi:hypothetical protein AALO_G00116150 [Alosa alosa]|uniref:Uncharacterized protein n=1 Tax=Alosa alosa TaxID=278164 RepID=A0AAV6GQB4_9TELE|nr:hypothetical protein AALO_G00116150 [Alosa alosa]